MVEKGIAVEFQPCMNPEVTWREYQRGVLTETGIAMNPTASYVFKLCDGTHSIAEITKSYQHAYGLEPDVADEDVVMIIRELTEQKVLLASQAS